MPITINSNVTSLRTERQLSVATSELRTVAENFSTGLRINRASDDAAGLSIAEDLNSSARVLNQGISKHK